MSNEDQFDIHVIAEREDMLSYTYMLLGTTNKRNYEQSLISLQNDTSIVAMFIKIRETGCASVAARKLKMIPATTGVYALQQR